MEHSSSVCLAKDLVGLIDNNTSYIYDISQKKFVQSYSLTGHKLKIVKLKVQEETTLALLSDTQGNIHFFNVGKNEKVASVKVHEEEIINMKIVGKNVYSLDRSGVLKVTDLTIYQVVNLIRLKSQNSQKKSHFYHFDLDPQEKYIVYNNNSKIKLLNILNGNKESIGHHSANITSLNFSSDGKYVITMTNKDYFISIWSRQNPTNSPVGVLERSSLTLNCQMNLVQKGIYDVFSYSTSTINGYRVSIDKLDALKPVPSVIAIDFPERNLISLAINSEGRVANTNSLFYLYGKTFNAAYLNSGVVNYSKGNVLKEMKMTITNESQSEAAFKKGVVIPNSVGVMNEVEMTENIQVDGTMTYPESKGDITTTEGGKITLLNIIKNCIINGDNATFTWALEQKDEKLIESTVSKMNAEIIQGFLQNLITVFQSNNFYKKNTLPWFNCLMKFHKTELIKYPAMYASALQTVQSLIKNRTQHLSRLVNLKEKLQNTIELSLKKSKPVKSAITYEPLLVYNESDSEEEKKTELSNKLKKQGINKLTKDELLMKNEEEEDDMEPEEEMNIDDEMDFDEIAEEFANEEMQVEEENKDERSEEESDQ